MPIHPRPVVLQPSRRAFLADVGMGFTGLALGELLLGDGIARAGAAETLAVPHGLPHVTPKAKRVIWIFLVGGMSHLESFDPKPALTEFAGKEIGETPHKDVLTATFVNDNLRPFVQNNVNGTLRLKLFPPQVGFAKRGASGLDISDWWPHLAGCADDLAIVRSMWTTDNDHGAQLQFHTGRHVLEGPFPTIGSWIHYGLGSVSDNLPRFVVLGTPIADCCGGIGRTAPTIWDPSTAACSWGSIPKTRCPLACRPMCIARSSRGNSN